MNFIPFLTDIHIKHWFSSNNILMGSTIVLQLLVCGFLTVIFVLNFLSQNTIWTTVALVIMNQK